MIVMIYEIVLERDIWKKSQDSKRKGENRSESKTEQQGRDSRHQWTRRLDRFGWGVEMKLNLDANKQTIE